MIRYADHHQKRITRQSAEGREPVDTPLSKREYRERVGKTTQAFYEAFLPEDHPGRAGGLSATFSYINTYHTNCFEEAYYWFSLDAHQFLQDCGVPLATPRVYTEEIDAGVLTFDLLYLRNPDPDPYDISMVEQYWMAYFYPGIPDQHGDTLGKRVAEISPLPTKDGRINFFTEYHSLNKKENPEVFPPTKASFAAMKDVLVQYINHDLDTEPAVPPEVQYVPASFLVNEYLVWN